MEDSARLRHFYEQGYSLPAGEAERFSRWRSLSAIGKAAHVVELCRRAGLEPGSTLDVGCGDGALLCALSEGGFGGKLTGLEITDAAVAIAREREQIDSVERYDGQRVPAADGGYELGVLSHVLEHVEHPATLLTEVARACRAVVIEVPLEANLSASRRGKREHAAEVGHLHSLDRADARSIAREAGLVVRAELEDPLSREVQLFFADDTAARTRANLRWATRAGLHRMLPDLARRLFTVHYAALCTPPDSPLA
ncbi:MAG TPA: class I SAM-dependent methyltransferase [Solirubrobacteraceae bacterium]